MSNIRLISSTNIKPTSSNYGDIDHHQIRHDRLELIPCDLRHLMFVPMQRGLIFSKPKPQFEKDHLSLVDHLKATFSRTLDIFYPLAGRLAVVENDHDGTASFSVDCSGGGAGNGALFVHAAADGVAVSDVLDKVNVPSDLIRSFFPMNGVVGYQAVSEPFLAVQVTELADGIFLACTMSHLVADGTSLWHFLNTWSHISRGGGVSTPPPPVFDRRPFFGDAFDLPLRVPFSYKKIPRFAWRPETSPVRSRIFHFSKAKIAQLKAKANAETGTNTAILISSLQALMAHMWVSVTRSRGLRGDEEVTYIIAVGLRRRTQPPLPDEYFGNASRTVSAKSTAGELLDRGGFGLAARLINETIASQTPEVVRSYLAELARRPELEGSAELPRNFLFTGGSPRFDVFGNDFGWGPPIAARRNIFLVDGNMTPTSGAEQGSVDFEVFLSAHTLHALAKDPEFSASLT